MDNLNVAQTIFVKAKEAAVTLLGLELTPHELATKELELFTATGLDPADYSAWKGYVLAQKTAMQDQAIADKGRLASLATVKAASEQKPKPAV